jgi:uncharacterized protein (DUF342 family)
MGEKPFRLDFRDEGVFLLVDSGVNVPVSDVLDYLHAMEIEEYDASAVTKAVEEPGDFVRVADRKQELDRKAEILIKMGEDDLTASVRILPPLGNPWPVLEEIRGELAQMGVVFGVNEEVLEKIAKERPAKKWIEVARGVPPVNGKDAKFVYHVDLHKAKPKEISDTKVDMKELGVVVSVRADQELLEKVPPQISSDGTNVYGKPIPAVLAKDKVMPSGKNTYVSEDGLHLYSSIDGCVLVQDGKIHVQPIYQVEGDVDYGTGNIEFIGDVHVKQTLRDGFEIKAGGNVIIGGVVEGATITAEGNVEIKGGVRGMNKAFITAKGTVLVGYLDQCTLEAGGNVMAKNAIMHCTIRAKGDVIAEGAKGLIVGGSVHAGSQIRCQTLGNEMGTKTDLHAGVNPLATQEKAQAEKELAEREKQYQEVTKNIDFLKKVESLGKMDNEKRQILLKLTQAKFQLQAKMEKEKKILEKIEQQLGKMEKEGRISVQGVVYPGVSIHLRGLTYIVRDALKYVTFMYDQGEIRATSYIK